MRRNLVLAVLTGMALLAADASAAPMRGGGGGGGRAGGFGGGGRAGGISGGGRSGGGISRGSIGGGGRSFTSSHRSGGGFSSRSVSRPGSGSSFRSGGGSFSSSRSGYSPRTSPRSGGAFSGGRGDFSRGQGVSRRGQAPVARTGTSGAVRRDARGFAPVARPASRAADRTGFTPVVGGRRAAILNGDGNGQDLRGPASRTGFTDRGGGQPRGPGGDRGGGGGNVRDPNPGRGNDVPNPGKPHIGDPGGRGPGGDRGGGNVRDPNPGRGRDTPDNPGSPHDGQGRGRGRGGDDGDRPGRGGNDGPVIGRPGSGQLDRDRYRGGWRNGRRVDPRDSGGGGSSWDHHGDSHHGGSHHGSCDSYHGWYDSSHWYLSFSFGFGCGSYVGYDYYWPYHSWTLGCDYAFFYPQPVTWCYAPYGFYWDYQPLYVTRYEVVRETVPVYEYEPRTVVSAEEAGAAPAAGPAGEPGDEVKVAEPKPAAASPATEKLLREASGKFKEGKYYEAAVDFRLAALSSPDQPGAYFALAQALVALGHDEYAARVMRKAILLEPRLLDETGDLSGVYGSQEEFDRVLAALAKRAEAAPADGDARFLLGAERFFTGDARSRETLGAYCDARKDDRAASLLRTAVEVRFRAAEDLPEVKRPANPEIPEVPAAK